jgi:hypothetical protein
LEVPPGMTDHRAALPDPQERAGLNAAFLAVGAETGWWDDHGNPAPWPDDIEDWTPVSYPPTSF